MGASRWTVFATVTFPLLLPGLGNAFLVTFIESIADFANPMIIGGSYDLEQSTHCPAHLHIDLYIGEEQAHNSGQNSHQKPYFQGISDGLGKGRHSHNSPEGV